MANKWFPHLLNIFTLKIGKVLKLPLDILLSMATEYNVWIVGCSVSKNLDHFCLQYFSNVVFLILHNFPGFFLMPKLFFFCPDSFSFIPYVIWCLKTKNSAFAVLHTHKIAFFYLVIGERTTESVLFAVYFVATEYEVENCVKLWKLCGDILSWNP